MVKIAISTCPNDIYTFYGFLTKLIKPNFPCQFVFADIQELNQMAGNDQAQVIKLSFANWFNLKDQYHLLESGAALGFNCGPLLLSNNRLETNQKLNLVGIPGKNTTAFLLLEHFFPDIKQTKQFLFSDIPQQLINQTIDAGLVIHETRFTYQNMGLTKIADLGQLFEEKFKQPLPLGGIFAHKSLGSDRINELNSNIKKSIQLAQQNHQQAIKLCQQYAQEIEPKVIEDHIKLYVNHFSINLGKKGHQAINTLESLSQSAK